MESNKNYYLQLLNKRDPISFLYQRNSKQHPIPNFTQMYIKNIIFGHLISTCLLGIAKIEGENNWIENRLYNKGLVSGDQPWHQVYFWSYYWACTIMITVGFGDITPVNYKEAVVVAFIEIFSSIVLAYNISEVGSILSSIRKNSEALERKLGVLRRMMANSPVPVELQLRIENYLTNQVQIEYKFQYDQHSNIIKALPEQLKQQYLAESNRVLYQNIPVFRYFQKATLTRLNESFQGKVFYQGEKIIQAETGNDSVIIMRSGMISLKYWRKGSDVNGSTVQTIAIKEKELKGLHISTNVFSNDSPINYNVIAEKYSFGMRLSREQFVQVLRKNRVDYYFYRSILGKHQKQENNYEYVECQYCPKQYHNKFQCPKLHYNPLKSLVIIKKIKERQLINKPTIGKFTRIVKPNISHSYITRNSIFKFLQLKISLMKQDQLDKNFEIDQLYDFSMYFSAGNPQTIKEVSLNKKQLPEKEIFRRLKVKRRLLSKQSFI